MQVVNHQYQRFRLSLQIIDKSFRQRRDIEFALGPGLATPECSRVTVQSLTAESGAHASHTRHQILHKNRKANIRRVHFIPGRAPLVAADEIDGQHGFASARTPVDDGRRKGLELLPQGVEQSLPANARNLGGNRYLAGDYLHEIISDLETQYKRCGLRTS